MTTDITLCANADECPMICGRDPEITEPNPLHQSYADFYDGEEGYEYYMDTGAYGDNPND